MGIFRRRLRVIKGGANNRGPSPANIRVHSAVSLVRVVIVLAVYAVWSSYTFPRNSGWKARVRLTLEKQFKLLGREPLVEANPGKVGGKLAQTFPDDPPGMTTHGIPPVKYHKRLVPCGLIVIDDASAAGEEEVLPLATSLVAEMSGATTVAAAETTPHAASTLHARALEKYPELEKYVVTATTTTGKRMIPRGTFKLRMGSEESTIEESPLLWILEHEDSDDEKTRDLVLGTDFWKEHSAEFGSEDVYLFPSSSSSKTKRSRVWVPYISIRSRPSFGTDL
jgi:hypothetical protein